jgi:diguanylate cyclase (GGDEF)-like protein/PAS domain S-box-containing protein
MTIDRALDLRLPFDFPRLVDDLLTVGLVVVDRRFTIVMWNRFMELNSSVRAESVLGKNLFDAFPELNRNWLEKKIKSCLVLKTASFSSWQQRPYLFRFKVTSLESGETDFMHQDASIFPVYDHAGVVQGACIAIQDATPLAEAKRLLDRTMDQALDLEETSQRDSLTGLYNRKFFDEQITQEILSSRRYGWSLALAMIDIDHFKQVNDTFGHSGGDAVLRSLSNQLRSMLRSSDTLCRYGGEEFALILPHINLDNAGMLLERLRKAVECLKVDLPDGQQVSVTMSTGFAILQDGFTPGQLVTNADESLYTSKHAGRNRITAFTLPPTANPVAAQGDETVGASALSRRNPNPPSSS